MNFNYAMWMIKIKYKNIRGRNNSLNTRSMLQFVSLDFAVLLIVFLIVYIIVVRRFIIFFNLYISNNY